MKKGLIIALIVGLGLLFLPVASLRADVDYGAYEKFLSQMSPALRALAAYGQLQNLILRDAGGTVTSTVSADGTWVIYTGGVQDRALEYDDTYGKWYTKTVYYTKGSILQYAITYKLEKNEETGEYEQIGIDTITQFDAIGQAQFAISVGDGVIWDLTSADALQRSLEGTAYFDALLLQMFGEDFDLDLWYGDEEGAISQEQKDAFWERLYNSIVGNMQDAADSETGFVTFDFTMGFDYNGDEHRVTCRFKLTNNGETMSLQYDTTPLDDEDDSWSETSYTVEGYTLGDNINISNLDPAQLAQLFQAVTNGVPKSAIVIGGVTAVVELTDVFLSGADLIELGEAGVTAYLDTLGVDMGCIRVFESTTWEVLDSTDLEGLIAGVVEHLYNDCKGADDKSWSELTEDEQEEFWDALYAGIASNIASAVGGEAIFDVTIHADGDPGNEVIATITFKLEDNGEGVLILSAQDTSDQWHELSDYAGETGSDWVVDGYECSGDQLVIGAGADGIFGTDDDEKVDISEATAEDLKKSQAAAMQIMCEAIVESGASAGENVLDLGVRAGQANVDDDIEPTIEDVTQMNMEEFKEYIETSPWADNIRTNNFTEADWAMLRDFVLQLCVDTDGDGNYIDPEDTVAWNTEYTLSTGQKFKFVQELVGEENEGWRLDIQGWPDVASAAPTDYYHVRHVTYKDITLGESTEIEEDRISTNVFYVSRYTFLTGDYAGTGASLQDPTIYGTRTQTNYDTYDPHMWGDPTLQGYVHYDGTNFTMTVTRWQDEMGNWHEGEIEINLDLSQLGEEEVAKFIEAATNGYLFMCWGIADEITDGMTLVIMGTGASPYIEP